jgi:hypothetical protein
MACANGAGVERDHSAERLDAPPRATELRSVEQCHLVLLCYRQDKPDPSPAAALCHQACRCGRPGRRAIRGGDRARLVRPSHPISRHGRGGRASFITAVRSPYRILDEAKLFIAVRDELDGRARSGPSPTGRLKCDGSRLRTRLPNTNAFEVPKLKLVAPLRTRGVLRDRVVAERKIVYLWKVGQGSPGLERVACRTLAMSSQRRSGTAPR